MAIVGMNVAPIAVPKRCNYRAGMQGVLDLCHLKNHALPSGKEPTNLRMLNNSIQKRYTNDIFVKLKLCANTTRTSPTIQI